MVYMDALFLPKFADMLLWDMVRGLDSFFCRSISVRAYNIFSRKDFSDVMDDFASDVLVRISRLWSVRIFSMAGLVWGNGACVIRSMETVFETLYSSILKVLVYSSKIRYGFDVCR